MTDGLGEIPLHMPCWPAMAGELQKPMLRTLDKTAAMVLPKPRHALDNPTSHGRAPTRHGNLDQRSHSELQRSHPEIPIDRDMSLAMGIQDIKSLTHVIVALSPAAASAPIACIFHFARSLAEASWPRLSWRTAGKI